MTNCCNSTRSEQRPAKYVCPVNGKPYNEVPSITVMHHILQPWKHPIKDLAYYFCEDPECDVVYFGSDDSTITTSELRTEVGIKQRHDRSPVCYCFGVTLEQSRTKPETKAFVIEQTRNHACTCTTSNPSGRCCLKDFPDG